MKKRTKTLPAIITGAAILIGGIWMINESRYPNAQLLMITLHVSS
ncbi:hypothetical protein [Priestia megaterium]